MINRILVPTDFSEVAGNALEFAIRLATKANAELHIIHVNPVPVADINFPQETYQLFMDELNQEAELKFEALKKAVLIPSNIHFVTDSSMGFITDEVIHYSKHHAIDLIVMGTTGASGIQELLIGSNTASVVGKSNVPVLVIPPSAHMASFKHLLYTSDYSEPEFPAISRMMYFAELYDANVSVIHMRSEADRYFKAEDNFFVKNKERMDLSKIHVEQIPQGDFSDAINEYIDHKGVDMVVMAKHNRSWFDRLFHRSLSKKMTYHTRVPLLVLNK